MAYFLHIHVLPPYIGHITVRANEVDGAHLSANSKRRPKCTWGLNDRTVC